MLIRADKSSHGSIYIFVSSSTQKWTIICTLWQWKEKVNFMSSSWGYHVLHMFLLCHAEEIQCVNKRGQSRSALMGTSQTFLLRKGISLVRNSLIQKWRECACWTQKCRAIILLERFSLESLWRPHIPSQPVVSSGNILPVSLCHGYRQTEVSQSLMTVQKK